MPGPKNTIEYRQTLSMAGSSYELPQFAYYLAGKSDKGIKVYGFEYDGHSLKRADFGVFDPSVLSRVSWSKKEKINQFHGGRGQGTYPAVSIAVEGGNPFSWSVSGVNVYLISVDVIGGLIGDNEPITTVAAAPKAAPAAAAAASSGGFGSGGGFGTAPAFGARAGAAPAAAPPQSGQPKYAVPTWDYKIVCDPPRETAHLDAHDQYALGFAYTFLGLPPPPFSSPAQASQIIEVLESAWSGPGIDPNVPFVYQIITQNDRRDLDKVVPVPAPKAGANLQYVHVDGMPPSNDPHSLNLTEAYQMFFLPPPPYSIPDDAKRILNVIETANHPADGVQYMSVEGFQLAYQNILALDQRVDPERAVQHVAAAPSFGSAPAFGAKPGFGTAPAFGAKPAFGSTPAFGAKPAFGSHPAPAQPPANFGAKPAAAPAFGTAPAFGAKPAFGSQPTTSTGAFGAKPAFGTAPAFGAKPTASAGAFGSQPTASAPAFGAKPAFGSQPAFGVKPAGFVPGTGFGAAKPTFATTVQPPPTHQRPQPLADDQDEQDEEDEAEGDEEDQDQAENSDGDVLGGEPKLESESEDDDGAGNEENL